MEYKRTTFCLETSTRTSQISAQRIPRVRTAISGRRVLCTSHTPSIRLPGPFPVLLAILLIGGEGPYPGARDTYACLEKCSPPLPSILLGRDETGEPRREELYPKTTGSRPISDKAKARDTSLGSGITVCFWFSRVHHSYQSQALQRCGSQLLTFFRRIIPGLL